MTVPDTNTFSLQDVVDVVEPSYNTLQSCFDDSIDSYFDANYKGAKNSLLNFRNYGQKAIILNNNYSFNSPSLGVHSTTFSEARNKGSATFMEAGLNISCNYFASEFWIRRAFFVFNHTNISSIDNAKINLLKKDDASFGNTDYYVYSTTLYNEPSWGDFDAFGQKLSNKSVGMTATFNQAGLNYIQNAINNNKNIVFCIRHAYDVDNIAPAESNSAVFHRTEHELIINE